MKKILYFIAVGMLLTSCCCADGEKTFKTETTGTRLDLGYSGVVSLHKFKYENHQYIILKGSEQIALEHDPNCPCHYNF